MKYQTHQKFLNTEFFDKIKGLVMDQDFPWRRRNNMTTNIKDKMYFTYCFYNDMTCKSQFYEPYIIPILKKLEAEAPLQVRANMFVSALFKVSSWHCDFNFKCKTAILYLNDCDGGTELIINKKPIFIKSVANQMLVFDTGIKHRALTSEKEPIRYIINFNYFTK